MNDEVGSFVDSNILVYAYDADAAGKREIARARLQHLWETRQGVLSTQVMQEFYVTVTRKLRQPLDRATARRVVSTYLAWPVQVIGGADILAASDLEEQYQLSFWDALVFQAARRAGASRVLSEDFQAGRRVAGIVVENPFVS
ncbi:MAG: PIN domain-containing protein [Chloroflexi bacterium]|nr:PIN domain-containing protein [Chloroflexota bacterium]